MKVETLKELLLKGQFVVHSAKSLNDDYSLIEFIFDQVAIEDGVFQRDTLVCKLKLECIFDMDSFIIILSEKYSIDELSKQAIIERLGIIFYEAIDLIVGHNYGGLVELFHSKRGKIASKEFGF